MKSAVKKLLIILLFITSNIFSQRTYIVNIIVDDSYKGTNESIDSVIAGVNYFFKDLNINFKINSYLRTNFISKDKTLDNTIDRFCNCGEDVDITIGILGEHKSDKVGLAFRASLYTRIYSRLVVDLSHLNNDRKVFVLAHEICHIFGLKHSDDKFNLMHDITYYNNLTSEQIDFLKMFSIPEN